MESPPLEAYIAVKTLLQRVRHYDAKDTMNLRNNGRIRVKFDMRLVVKYLLPCSAMFYIPFIKFEFTYLLTIPSLLGK